MSCLYSLKSQHTPRSTLFPYTTLFRSFLRALNLRGVPWTFSGNAGLYGRPEIRLLIAFLRTVAHPDDSVSLHYLASSDIYQVPIFDLTECATYADRKNRWLFHVLRKVPDEVRVG